MTMLKIMANENMAEWTMLPGVINETVAAAKKFLEERPEEAAKVGQVKCGSQDPDFGARIISRFLGLGWSLTKVSEALAQLHDSDKEAKGPVERQAIEMMPHQTAAGFLRKTVKSIAKTRPVSAEVQVRAAVTK